MTNALYYGDNLDILRERTYFPDACVDLIYLDPPFNSSRNYNVLFKDESGRQSDAQITAFEDTWHWGATAEETYTDLLRDAPGNVGKTIEALRLIVGTNQMMAYLVMMTARLVELHRVLKPTGSLYLHCDPTASHYLKIILDAIFGALNFRNEITWKRTSSHNDAKRKYGNVSDIILYYTKSDNFTFNVQYVTYNQDYLDKFYRHVDENGRRYRISDLRSPNPRPNLTYDYKGYKPHPNGWAVSIEKMRELDAQGRLHYPKKKDGRIQLKRFLDEMQGTPVSELWDDIKPVQSQARERLGYPTQKPVALLERIIQASSNPGDVVLDPFCGCGTAIAAAHKLERVWRGIDVTHLSVSLMKYRLRDAFDLKAGVDYQVIGEPEDAGGARQLAQDDRYQFQWWALSLVAARPLGGQVGDKTGKKGADGGIDGEIVFLEHSKAQSQRRVALVQVKGGRPAMDQVRAFIHTVEREKAALGVFIALEPFSEPMRREAVSAGYYESAAWGRVPKIQLLTIDDLFSGKRPDIPGELSAFKQAQREKNASDQQLGLL